MSEEKVCPNCNESVESGASYCGNCGFKLNQASTLAQIYSKGGSGEKLSLTTPAAAGPNLPAYAVAYSHHKQHWASMALAFGILGIGGGFLIPIIGIVFGITALVLITSSYHLTHQWLRLASLAVSILAILVSLGFWVSAIEHDPRIASTSSAGTSNGVATVNVNTPCYSLTFSLELNVNNSSGSCSMNAYNGTSFNESSNVYKILASQTTTVAATNLDSFSKTAIEQDISKNLPTFKITNEAANLFDGSPAYFIQANNASSNTAFIEETIYHPTLTGNDNFFVIVHASSGQSVNVNNLAKSWQWND